MSCPANEGLPIDPVFVYAGLVVDDRAKPGHETFARGRGSTQAGEGRAGQPVLARPEPRSGKYQFFASLYG
jgi:hypothetical protein